jgi:hypothetical protein
VRRQWPRAAHELLDGKLAVGLARVSRMGRHTDQLTPIDGLRETLAVVVLDVPSCDWLMCHRQRLTHLGDSRHLVAAVAVKRDVPTCDAPISLPRAARSACLRCRGHGPSRRAR